MGLATIDPHSQKEHTEIHKIPKFGVNQASFDWDTAIQKLTKKPCIRLARGKFELTNQDSGDGKNYSGLM